MLAHYSQRPGDIPKLPTMISPIEGHTCGECEYLGGMVCSTRLQTRNPGDRACCLGRKRKKVLTAQ